MASPVARALRRNPTEAERRLWSRLRHGQLDGFRFRRQVPLGPYIADFACLSARLIVEVDGGQHASRSEQDGRRTTWLESSGFRVVRFWNHEVFTTPPPQPSPTRGEGEESWSRASGRGKGEVSGAARNEGLQGQPRGAG